MKLATISFTDQGSHLNQGISAALSLQGYDCVSYGEARYAEKYHLEEIDTSLKEWTKKMFAEKDGLIFIGATGIAVRSIAPFLSHKAKDPAVVVMDEKGMFSISLVSGHLGGANELAGTLANLTGAIPVITTATDVNGRFAVDLFAKKNNLFIENMTYAKEISADVLDEKKIGFSTDYPVMGSIPEELEVWDPKKIFEGSRGICVTIQKSRSPYQETLRLIPRIVTIGIGCKKETDAEALAQKTEQILKMLDISAKSIEKIASIDLKEKEPGICQLAQKYDVPFVTFTAEELKNAPGDYTPSTFVESVTGVDNVCERSAVLASKNGRLIQKKTAAEGVTVAVAVRDWSVEFG